MNKLWREILYPHSPLPQEFAHMDRFRATAKDLNYPYFAWNGVIYTTSDGKDTNMTCFKGEISFGH